VAAITVYSAPEDGGKGRPKHVEHTCSFNKHNTARVASCWFIIYIYYRLMMHGISNIKCNIYIVVHYVGILKSLSYDARSEKHQIMKNAVFHHTPESKQQSPHSHKDDDMQEVMTWFKVQAADFYDSGIQKLVPRLNKCLDNAGDYVEK